MSSVLRRYRQEDHRDACRRIFRSNLRGERHPAGTMEPWEEEAYLDFLDRGTGEYHVLERAGRTVACGGSVEEGPGLVSITWTLVDRGLQGRGVGRSLLEALLARADARVRGHPSYLWWIRLDTLPETVGFFHGVGFQVMREEPGGYPDGRTRVEMIRSLSEHAPGPAPGS